RYSVVKGLVDAEAAACLCTAVKVAVGVPRPAPSGSVPLGFDFVLNNCGRKAPADFTC
uniref:Hydrophobic seed protein domain-containing protein n=2 Tax=Setaria italica TaxID=4555 RepID=A0A0Q3VUG9_SETIT